MLRFYSDAGEHCHAPSSVLKREPSFCPPPDSRQTRFRDSSGTEKGYFPENRITSAPYPLANPSSICKILLRPLRLTGIIVLVACLHATAGMTAQTRISI